MQHQCTDIQLTDLSKYREPTRLSRLGNHAIIRGNITIPNWPQR